MDAGGNIARCHFSCTIIRITEAYTPDLPQVRRKVTAGLLHLINQGGDKWTASVVRLKVKLVDNSSVNPFLLA